MGLFDQFPYTNFHEMNLDWILQALKEIQTTTEQFVAINSLKYADPIQWNITSQYEKNTIVIDPQSGTAYISVQAVPSGVALTNEDYWTVVFDLEQFVTKANNNFTSRVEEATTTTATFATPHGSLVIWGGELYVANTNIIAGDQYVVGSNITRIHVEDITGRLIDLATTDKSNLVAAINELVTNLANEITDRENADTNLQTNIDAEATARENADTNLQTNIDAEATARENADTNLQTTLQTNIDAEATARENADNTINTRIDNLDILPTNERNFLLISDSYGMRPESQPTWTEILTENLSNCRQKSTSSIGFVTSTNFLTLLTQFYEELTEDERNEITDIVVGGGWNDARAITSGTSTGTGIQTAIQTFVEYANSHFIHAKVWLAFMAWQSNDSVQLSDVTLSSLISTQSIYNQSYYDNLYHLGNVSYVMKCCKMLDSSYFHPNSTASRFLAHIVYNNIVGIENFNYAYSLSATDFSFTTGSGTFNSGIVSIDNGIARVFLQFLNVTTPTTQFVITFNADVWPSGHNSSQFNTCTNYSTGESYLCYIRNTRSITVFVPAAITNQNIVFNLTINTMYDN